MAPKLIVLLDDRDPVADSVIGALGAVRFSDIIRKRRRLVDDMTALCAEADEVIHLDDSTDVETLALRIHTMGEQSLYLRLPLCLAPLQSQGLTALIEKARYALEPLFCSALFTDEAVVLTPYAQAAALISAQTPEARRGLLLALREEARDATDHAEFTDIRKPRNLMRFLSGATEMRHFNQARTSGAVFHKSSADVAKMKAEHAFFSIASPRMQRFLMPTMEYWEQDGMAGYSMENLSVPDAALQFVHNAFDREDFAALLETFFDFLDSREKGQNDAQATLAAGRQHILGKLSSRMEALLDTDVGQHVNALLARSGPMGDLEAMTERAQPLIDDALKAANPAATVLSHGDACFSNILFDRRLGMMRLIDPKGATRREDAFLHPLYDIAKFSHSVLGGYDFINNGLFQITLGSALTLDLNWTTQGPAPWAGEMFRAQATGAGYDIKAIRGVELSLFLSMLPLHIDRPDKVMGFALAAAHIIEELEGGTSVTSAS